MIWVGSMVIFYLGDWKGFMLSKWAIENDFIIFSFLTKIILDDWKWFISGRPKMIFSGPFMANWKQSPLFTGNTKGFVLFTSDQNNFHHRRLLLLFFSKWLKTISMCMGGTTKQFAPIMGNWKWSTPLMNYYYLFPNDWKQFPPSMAIQKWFASPMCN